MYVLELYYVYRCTEIITRTFVSLYEYRLCLFNVAIEERLEGHHLGYVIVHRSDVVGQNLV